jgi:PKD repeat protein
VSAATASHVYNTPGTYTVTGKVTDDYGAVATATATITVAAPVNQAPVANLTLSETAVVAPTTVTASTAASTDADGTIASSVIAWGDGSTSTGTSASHLYSKDGTYTVTATVTDNKGAKSTATSTVTVNCGVNILSPANNAITTSSVHVVATASSKVNITAVRIYVDYVSVYLVNNTSKIDTYITLTKGTHRVVVQSWDSAGVVNKSTVFVSVQ